MLGDNTIEKIEGDCEEGEQYFFTYLDKNGKSFSSINCNPALLTTAIANFVKYHPECALHIIMGIMQGIGQSNSEKKQASDELKNLIDKYS